MQITTQDNDSVDEICFAIFGRTAGIAEQIYTLNIGLAEHGPILPAGINIKLPQTTNAAPVRRDIIQLWS